MLPEQPFQPDCFRDATLVVTGATSGIGMAACLQFERLGARLVCIGRDQARVDALKAQLQRAQDHDYSLIDFADVAAAAESLDALLKALDSVQGAFHCAGRELMAPLRMLDSDAVGDHLAINLESSISLARSLSRKKVMVNGGSIVFMSSVSAVRGKPGMTVYGAAKAGVIGLTKSLSVELAARQIRVNCLVAGGVKTEMHDRIVGALPDDAVDAYSTSHPLGFGAPDDVVNAAIFLLSNASRWVTGTELVVDGGYSAT